MTSFGIATRLGMFSVEAKADSVGYGRSSDTDLSRVLCFVFLGMSVFPRKETLSFRREHVAQGEMSMWRQ